MNELQIELTKLIGKKELSFGCLVKYVGSFPQYYEGIHRVLYTHSDGETVETIGGKEQSTSHCLGKEDYEIINHQATLSDFHRWMNEEEIIFEMVQTFIRYGFSNNETIPYDSSKDLLDQEESTLEQIISLIKSNQ